MKTINSANTTTVKALFLTFVLLATILSATYGQQKDCISQYLSHLPKNLELKENGPQRYLITTDYFNGDVYGNFINKTRVTGEYTRGLEDGTVKWNNVEMAHCNTREGSFSNASTLEYMEGYSYTPSAKMVEPEAFSDFPPMSFHAKNLVWDMLGIEGFAWYYFDSLKLNQSFKASDFNGSIQLAGQGSFTNRDIQLKWTGISKMNNEMCALIEYRTMDNPLFIDTEQMKMKGRSHYWGTIYVSLEDKQIEHAELYEDVVMDMKMDGQTNNQLMNATRTIIFEKLN